MRAILLFVAAFFSYQTTFAFMYSARSISSRSYYDRSKSDQKAGMNTYAKTFEEEGRIKVNVRGCGSRVVIANSKGENPPVGQIIQMNMSRCAIIDWVK